MDDNPDTWLVPQAELIAVRDWILRENEMKAILEILGKQSLAQSHAPGDFDSGESGQRLTDLAARRPQPRASSGFAPMILSGAL